MTYIMTERKAEKKKYHFAEWITILVVLQTFLIPVEIIPGINIVFRIIKLPVLLGIWFFLIVSNHSKIPLKRWLVWLGIWVSLMGVLTLLGSVFAQLHLIVDASFLLYGLLVIYYSQKDNQLYCESFYWISMVSIGVTCLYSAFQVQKYPLLARAMASGSETMIREATGGVLPRGVGGYEFIYGFVLVIPMLVNSLKRERRGKRFLAAFSLFAGLFYISVAQYTIAILLAVLAVGLSCIEIKNIKILFMGLFLTVVVFIESGLAVLCLRALGNLFSSSEMILQRLNQVIMAIEMKSLNEIDRMQLYQWNIDSFLQRPLGNVWDDLHHNMVTPYLGATDSEWLYLLSYFGIPLALVLFCFLFAYKKQSTSKWKSTSNTAPVQMTWLLFWIIGLLNTLFRSTVCPALILFVLPCFAMYRFRQDNNREFRKMV